MKIIQSYAHFDEGSPYLHQENLDKKILNFYSFLLSYLTLKKYYGGVTMYCDRRAHDSLVKYIPYDNVIILENKNPFKFWSYYKVDVIRKVTGDFIHVDSDVFIFDNIFQPFINGGYDIIVQDKIPMERNYAAQYVDLYNDYLKNNEIFNPNEYDGKCFSCGTVGFKTKVKKPYIKMADSLKNSFSNGVESKMDYIGMVCEELALYLTALKQGFNSYEILSYDDVINHGVVEAGNLKKYTHMYLGSKYNIRYVKLIKKKILEDFPDYKKYVEQYEKDMGENHTILKQLI